MSSPIRIELFGELRVAQGDLVTSRFATQKAAALLAYLAYHQGQSHSREALASLFWRESEASSARNSLSTALWSLRRLLNPHDETPDPVLCFGSAEDKPKFEMLEKYLKFAPR